MAFQILADLPSRSFRRWFQTYPYLVSNGSSRQNFTVLNQSMGTTAGEERGPMTSAVLSSVAYICLLSVWTASSTPHSNPRSDSRLLRTRIGFTLKICYLVLLSVASCRWHMVSVMLVIVFVALKYIYGLEVSSWNPECCKSRVSGLAQYLASIKKRRIVEVL